MSAARVAAAVSITLAVFVRAPQAQRPLQALLPHPAAPDAMCGTALERDVRAVRPYAATAAPDGAILSFEQDPPLAAGVRRLRRHDHVPELRGCHGRLPLLGDSGPQHPRASVTSISVE